MNSRFLETIESKGHIHRLTSDVFDYKYMNRAEVREFHEQMVATHKRANDLVDRFKAGHPVYSRRPVTQFGPFAGMRMPAADGVYDLSYSFQYEDGKRSNRNYSPSIMFFPANNTLPILDFTGGDGSFGKNISFHASSRTETESWSSLPKKLINLQTVYGSYDPYTIELSNQFLNILEGDIEIFEAQTEAQATTTAPA